MSKLLLCKFIHKGKEIFLIDNIIVNESILIYIFIKDQVFKNEFINIIFNKNINLSNNLQDTNAKYEIEECNTELCEYFKDKDFINLLDIVKTKPQYLEMINAYLSHGDIIDKIDIDKIDIDKNFKYEKELNILNENLKPHIQNWDENKVKKILIEYNGNVNLTSRYILI